MGMLEYPESNTECVKRKGLLRVCSRHKLKFNPTIVCSECRKEKGGKEKRTRELFKDVVWLSDIDKGSSA